MTAAPQGWSDEVAQQVLERVKAVGDTVLVPKAIQLEAVVDALDEEAWRVVLVLPRPEGATWDRDDVFAARMVATTVFDEIVEQEGRQLPGLTLAIVTTDEAAEDDIAAEDAPEADEDPGQR